MFGLLDCAIAASLPAPSARPAEQLREALRVLYEETADYIRINHLGDVHHNRSMQMARDALGIASSTLGEEMISEVKPEVTPSCSVCGAILTATHYVCKSCGHAASAPDAGQSRKLTERCPACGELRMHNPAPSAPASAAREWLDKRFAPMTEIIKGQDYTAVGMENERRQIAAILDEYESEQTRQLRESHEIAIGHVRDGLHRAYKVKIEYERGIQAELSKQLEAAKQRAQAAEAERDKLQARYKQVNDDRELAEEGEDELREENIKLRAELERLRKEAK